MADVEAIVLVAGEVRQVEKKRDFTDTSTGEVRVGKGRRAKVLTFGGFVDLSIPAEFDEVPFEQGEVLLVQARVVPWVIPPRVESGQVVGSARHGTAFVYVGPVTGEQLESVTSGLLAAAK